MSTWSNNHTTTLTMMRTVNPTAIISASGTLFKNDSYIEQFINGSSPEKVRQEILSAVENYIQHCVGSVDISFASGNRTIDTTAIAIIDLYNGGNCYYVVGTDGSKKENRTLRKLSKNFSKFCKKYNPYFVTIDPTSHETVVIRESHRTELCVFEQAVIDCEYRLFSYNTTPFLNRNNKNKHVSKSVL